MPSFLAPSAALAGFAVVIPLLAILLRERRLRAVRRRLGLADPPARAHTPQALALVIAFALLAAAAAQPVVQVRSTVQRRTDAEGYVIFDITRSMLAARSAHSATRLQRSIDASIELRAKLADVPFGVGTITNRPLPNLFPSVDRVQFERVVRETIGVNRPPGTQAGLFGIATDFQSLEGVASDNWFSPGTTKRLVVLLTDGESDAFAVRHLLDRLAKGGVDLVIVRFWDRRERVFRSDGSVEPYRPDELPQGRLAELAALTAGGRVFSEHEVGAAVRAARAYLGTGPAVPVASPGHTISLAPYAVLAACLPLLLLLLPGLRARLAYSMLLRWPGSSRTARLRSPATRASLPPS
jgi:hypothetical protein